MATKRRVILNYPPASSVWHLPVGIAQLAACLKANGHEVIQRYGHILGLEHLLLSHDQEMRVEKALSIIRTPGSDVSDIHALHWARMTLEEMSRSIPNDDKKFVVERNNVSYVSGYYDGTIASAIDAVENRESHLWFDYFYDVELSIAEEFQPDVYGISIADERQLIQGLILASMVKDSFPECLVVIGGNFWSRVVSKESAQAFAPLFDHCDAIVYAEGFQPLSTIVDELDLVAPGVMVRDAGGTVRLTDRSQHPTSFQDLPTPIYDGGAHQWAPEPVYPLYTMSNCYRQCGFCAIAAGSDSFLGNPRVMSVSRVADHMIALGGRWFDFTDELMPVQRQIHLGEELKGRGYFGMCWQSYTTITNDLLDQLVCDQLYEAGCRCVQLGLETLTPSTLDRENKQWNHPDNYGRILRNLRQAGIQTHIFLIVGIPGERQTDTLRWLPFLEDHGENILTIKSGRYRLTRRSPEEQFGRHSEYIRVLPDQYPLHLNRDFEYVNPDRSVRKDVEAMRDLLEQACREHWAYGVTSAIPWAINRMRYSWKQLEAMSKELPPEAEVPHLARALNRLGSIAQYELKRTVSISSFQHAVEFARTL